MLAKPNLLELKKLIGAIDGSLPKKTRPFSLLAQGVPSSCLVEIAGKGKTSFVCAFLKEHAGLRTAWIERRISVNPYALWQRGVDVGSILFVECGGDSTWTVQQVLKSQVFQIMVVAEMEFKEKELRKFQLLVEKTESHLFLLPNMAHASWVPGLKLNLDTERGFPCK